MAMDARRWKNTLFFISLMSIPIILGLVYKVWMPSKVIIAYEVMMVIPTLLATQIAPI